MLLDEIWNYLPDLSVLSVFSVLSVPLSTFSCFYTFKLSIFAISSFILEFKVSGMFPFASFIRNRNTNNYPLVKYPFSVWLQIFQAFANYFLLLLFPNYFFTYVPDI